MGKYITTFAILLCLLLGPANVLAVNPADLVTIKNAGVSDKVIMAVVESNAIQRAIISVDEIISMKSMPEVVLKMIEDANQPIPDLDRQDTKDFAMKRDIKRAKMKLKLQKERLAVAREHLSKLITNPEILKLVKAGKIASKDFADITKYIKQSARDEDSVDYRVDKRLDIDIKEQYPSPSKKGYRKTHPDYGPSLEDLIIIKSID